MSEVVQLDQIGNKPACPYCHKQLANKSSVERHIKDGACRVQNPISKKELFRYKQDTEVALQNIRNDMQYMKKDIAETVKETMETTFKTLGQSLIAREKPMINNHNQNLNILCLGKDDNLLDMLSATEGIANALSYMKDCVLAQLAGDCRILEKAYKLDTEQAAIMYVNKSKTKFRYYDERRRLTTEGNASVMAKKIAGILQRSYLKGSQAFKTDILGEERDDLSEENMPELEAYDIHLWNEHVQRLADDKYQRKLLRSLKIPMAPPDE